MDKLNKDQRDSLATSLAVLALYDGGAEITSDQINALLTATNNEVEGYYPIIMSSFLSDPEKIAQLITTPGGSGGGGGGAGGDVAAGEAAEEEEEKAEEEEVGEAPVVDMFGGGGDGGDY